MQRFSFDLLEQSDLIVDAVYEGGRSGNAGDDPLPRLLGVSNQGGFRYLGTKHSPRLIVLTSSFNDPDWPDLVDRAIGTLVYFGDNKHPGRLLHETPRHGNLLLRDMFGAAQGQHADRSTIPPVLVFGNTGVFRDMTFLGLAVPGSPHHSPVESLVAVWKSAQGQRFQNYRAIMSVLDVPCVPRAWIDDIKAGNSLSPNCPDAWRRWSSVGRYELLAAQPTTEYRSRQEQMPDDEAGLEIVATMHAHFQNHPVAFEACAAKIAQWMDDNFLSFDLTRPSRDGGRDAIGQYRIGLGPSAIQVECALEAKCYGIDNSVGVKGVARLVGRLRHRQFGVLVTTSYVHSQAYQELTEDRHPVVVVAARDVVTVLKRNGMTTARDVQRWLESDFPIHSRPAVVTLRSTGE